jgi:hypothetical protein
MKYYIVGLLIFFMFIYYSNRIFEGFSNEAGPTANETGINTSINDLPTVITGESLCSIYSSKPEELNTKCGELTEKNCNTTSCCLWLNGQSCVAGNANGPTFRTKGGKNIDVKYYSYKNNLVGNKI